MTKDKICEIDLHSKLKTLHYSLTCVLLLINFHRLISSKEWDTTHINHMRENEEV